MTNAGMPPLSEPDKTLAVLIAMSVRNALEDFHVEHLSDQQMAQMNPIVRDAIATALHARTNALRHRAALKYLEFQNRLVPDYWEEPKLLDEYIEYWEMIPEAETVCTRCGRRIVDVGDGQSRWTHLLADGGMNVGCRAASFVAGAGWDESLDRGWKARL